MKTKSLTFLLALTFLFLLSGSSSAGFFSPDEDYYECIFKNMKDAANDLAVVLVMQSCKKKFPDEPKKGPSGRFGPKNSEDCILKHGKGVKNRAATFFISQICKEKFKKISYD
jgi:hypothetical protein